MADHIHFKELPKSICPYCFSEFTPHLKAGKRQKCCGSTHYKRERKKKRTGDGVEKTRTISVESTFRVLKSDLNMRPVHHQKDDHIESHIYLTILAYQLINTIRLMLKRSGINYGWENIVRIMSTQKIVTTKLLTIHQRRPTKPIKEAKRIYDAAGCIDIQKILKKYVVYH